MALNKIPKFYFQFQIFLVFEKSDFCALVKFIYIRFMIDGIGVEVGFDGFEYWWSANVCSENPEDFKGQ